MRSLRFIGFAAVGVAALALSACTTPAQPQSSDPAPVASITPQAGTGENVPDATEQTKTPPATPTCESLIPNSLVTQLDELGWTFQQSQIYGVDGPLAASIQCIWGKVSETSSEAAQVYGWSPIDDATAVAMQEMLVAQGWTKEVEGKTVYITAGSRSPSLDADGYGMTYKFVAGELTYADTKQGLLLIQAPR